MSDKEKKPSVEFEANVPLVVKLVKQPPKFKGTNKVGDWWGWDVVVDNVEHVLFADNALQEKIAPYVGKSAAITKKEAKNGGAKKYHYWEVREPLFDNNGNPVKEPKPAPDESSKALEQFRKDRKNTMFQSLVDALAVVEQFNTTIKPQNGYLLSHEDVRAIAISFSINYERKTKN